MATTYTPSLGLAMYADGDLVTDSTGTDSFYGRPWWTLDKTLIEAAIAGQTSIAVTGGTMTLSTTQGTVNQSITPIKIFTGTLGANQTIIVSNVSQEFTIVNSTSGAFSLFVKTATGAQWTVAQGSAQTFYCDGASNLVPISAGVVTSTGALAVTSLAAAGVSGNLQYNNSGSFGGTGAITYASPGPSGILLITAQNITDKPLIVRAANSQTANLQEWQNTSGTALANINAAGNITTTGTLSVTGASTLTGAVTSAASITNPLLIGGTGAASTLTIESTSGTGTSDAIIFKTAAQTEAFRINTSQQLVHTTLGVVGTPARSPTGGLTTGEYWTSNTWNMAIAGANVLTVNSTGTVTALLAGGSGASSSLTIESTTGAGTTDAIIFKTASQSEAFRINTSQQLVHTTLGVVGTPARSPTGGLTTGEYWTSNTWNMAVGGSNIATINSSGITITGTTTSATVAGGAAAGSTLTLESTTGAGTTDAIIFKTASQSEAFRVNTSQQLVHTTLGVVGTPARSPTGGLTTGEYWTSSTWNMAIAGANLLTLNATGLGIKGTTPSNGFLQIAAGTTAIAPIVLTSGTNLTSAAAGAFEYDGVQLYDTIDTSSGRGAVPVEQYFHLTSNGGNVSTIGNFFGTTSNFSLVASAYYMIDYEVWYTVTGGTPTVTWTFTNSAAPTSQNIVFRMSPVAGMVAPPGTATMLEGQIQNDTTTAKTIVTGTLAAATYYTFIRIYLQNGTGTSLKFQATASTNSITPLLGSWCRCRRMSPNNIGTFAA